MPNPETPVPSDPPPVHSPEREEPGSELPQTQRPRPSGAALSQPPHSSESPPRPPVAELATMDAAGNTQVQLEERRTLWQALKVAASAGKQALLDGIGLRSAAEAFGYALINLLRRPQPSGEIEAPTERAREIIPVAHHGGPQQGDRQGAADVARSSPEALPLSGTPHYQALLDRPAAGPAARGASRSPGGPNVGGAGPG